VDSNLLAFESMNGKNKMIEQQKPAAGSGSLKLSLSMAKIFHRCQCHSSRWGCSSSAGAISVQLRPVSSRFVGSTPAKNMDPKKLKRVISNRLSAQRSRIRKIQRLCDMEKKVQSLETLVAVLSSKVQREKDKQFLLRIEQQELRERIEAFANRETMVDARIEKRRAEIESLRQPQFTSQQQQMQVQTRHANSNQGRKEFG
ncbi:basic leucine zipper 61-like, partial [Gossypium hirsutum]|uniref:Basic leucine zipper 61-like n=1 Tax=Gossypium hirsutum TaxID=3635 RepID=A0ABM3BHF0_GOSHI